MKGLIAGGILFLLAFASIGLAGGFVPLWDDHPWECSEFCSDHFWQSATLEDVKAEIDGGADVNRARRWDQNYPLHLAIRAGASSDIVALLLASGADPNAEGYNTARHYDVPELSNQTTLLQLALSNARCRGDISRLLLEYGADPNSDLGSADGDRPVSPLNYALGCNRRGGNWSRPRSFELLESLLAFGADVNERMGHSGWTPLQYVANDGDPNTIDLFLRYGADPNARTDADQSSLLHIAARNNTNPDAVESILDLGFDVDALTGAGQPPLLLASKHNENPDVVQLLLERGADPTFITASGSTPLIGAVWEYPCEQAVRCKRVLALLLEHGADVDSHDGTGVTAFHASIFVERDIEVVRVLLDHGANVNGPSDTNPRFLASSLHWAVSNKNIEIVELLLERGAEVDARDKNGETPLHWAVRTGPPAPQLVQLLLRSGADINARDYSGNSPLLLREVDVELAVFLVENGADPTMANHRGVAVLHRALRGSPTYEQIELLLNHGADANASDEKGVSVLHSAMYGDAGTEIVALLLNHGADPNAVTLEDQAVLIAAVSYNPYPEVVNLLIGRGADVNVSSSIPTYWSSPPPYIVGSVARFTLLHWAVRKHASLAVVEILVRSGADLEAVDAQGKTPCQLAERLRFHVDYYGKARDLLCP